MTLAPFAEYADTRITTTVLEVTDLIGYMCRCLLASVAFAPVVNSSTISDWVVENGVPALAVIVACRPEPVPVGAPGGDEEPGPVVVSTVARGLASGFAPAFAFAVGVASVDLGALLLVLYGLAAVTRWLGDLFHYVKIAGALYLVYLGVRLWLARAEPIPVAPVPVRFWRSFWEGVLVDLANLSFEVFERAISDNDRIIFHQVDTVFRCVGIHALHERCYFVYIHWHRLDAASDEPSDARRVAYDKPRVIVDNHFHQYVAWVDALFFDDTLAALDADFLLGWHNDFENLLAHAKRFDTLFEVSFNRLLIP